MIWKVVNYVLFSSLYLWQNLKHILLVCQKLFEKKLFRDGERATTKLTHILPGI